MTSQIPEDLGALHSYENGDRSGNRTVRHNALGLLGRQGQVILFSLILARILGPTSFGIVAQATAYMTLMSLLLDQGLSAALLSSKRVTHRAVSSAGAVNILLALILAALTIGIGPLAARFFHTPQLSEIFAVLSADLLLGGCAIVPRMLLMRRLQFGLIAVSESASAAVGGISALAVAIVFDTYWAVVVQIIATDLVILVIEYVAARPPIPRIYRHALDGAYSFGIRVFIGNLFSYVSRNADNILVGRVEGSRQLAFYSVSYRVLLTPVALIGQAVSRILIPTLGRVINDAVAPQMIILKGMRSISAISFPLMFLVGASATDTIEVFMGPKWNPAATLMAILAITGARQAVTSMVAPIMLAYSRPDMHLRFNIAAALMQVSGMAIGLHFGGTVGLAFGYSVAGIVMMVPIFIIQRSLSGATVTSQLKAIYPSLHAAIWGWAAYSTVSYFLSDHIIRLAIGVPVYVCVVVLVLFLMHRNTFRILLKDARGFVGIRAS